MQFTGVRMLDGVRIENLISIFERTKTQPPLTLLIPGDRLLGQRRPQRGVRPQAGRLDPRRPPRRRGRAPLRHRAQPPQEDQGAQPQARVPHGRVLRQGVRRQGERRRHGRRCRRRRRGVGIGRRGRRAAERVLLRLRGGQEEAPLRQNVDAPGFAVRRNPNFLEISGEAQVENIHPEIVFYAKKCRRVGVFEINLLWRRMMAENNYELPFQAVVCADFEKVVFILIPGVEM